MRMGKLKKMRKKMLGAAARTTNRVELLGTRPRVVFSSRSVVVDTEWDLINAPQGMKKFNVVFVSNVYVVVYNM